jgi:hypothetical protein
MPNTIKATGLTVTKAFNKFFVAQDVFKKADGSEGKLNYKVWWSEPIQEGYSVEVIGQASSNVNEFVNQAGEKIVYAQLSINAKEVKVVSQVPLTALSSNWETF